MNITPYLSFNRATQNNRKHPADLKLPEMVRLSMMVTEPDTVPTAPYYNFWTTQVGITGWAFTLSPPTQFPLGAGGYTHNGIPSGSFAYPSGVVAFRDWFQMGAYTVLVLPVLKDINNNLYVEHLSNSIDWSAPDNPAKWVVTEVIGGVTVYTGAGWANLANSDSELIFAVCNGLNAAIFDTKGIGHLSYTGDFRFPFSYAKRSTNCIVASWPVSVNGWVYFIDTGGRLFKTDGSFVVEVTGPFNAPLIPELATPASYPTPTWPWNSPAGGPGNYTYVRMAFIDSLHRLLMALYLDTTCYGAALIDVEDSTFSFSVASPTAPLVQTGGFQLTDPKMRCHVQYVDLDVESVADPSNCYITPSIADAFENTWMDGEPMYINMTGRQTIRFWLNQIVNKMPMFKFTLTNTPTTKVRFHGMQIAYQDGGLR